MLINAFLSHLWSTPTTYSNCPIIIIIIIINMPIDKCKEINRHGDRHACSRTLAQFQRKTQMNLLTERQIAADSQTTESADRLTSRNSCYL